MLEFENLSQEEINDALSTIKDSVREMTNERLGEVHDVPYIDTSAIAVSEIHAKAISDYQDWPSAYSFPWERIYENLKKPANMLGLDIAIWHGGELVGLCWATPSSSKENLFLKYVERRKRPIEPRGLILPICLDMLQSYAYLLELEWIVIENPIPTVVKLYEEQGFTRIAQRGLALKINLDYRKNREGQLSADSEGEVSHENRT